VCELLGLAILTEVGVVDGFVVVAFAVVAFVVVVGVGVVCAENSVDSLTSFDITTGTPNSIEIERYYT